MKGYMRRRGPSWELRAYLGRDSVSGRKRYATRSVRGSKRAAERVLRDMVSAAEAGVTHRAGATFRELCETWLAHASGHLAANTVTETRRILDGTLLPPAGRRGAGGPASRASRRPVCRSAASRPAGRRRHVAGDGTAGPRGRPPRADGRCALGVARREPGVHRLAAPFDPPGDLTTSTGRRRPPDRCRGPGAGRVHPPGGDDRGPSRGVVRAALVGRSTSPNRGSRSPGRSSLWPAAETEVGVRAG
jgi:hypothetical protein